MKILHVIPSFWSGSGGPSRALVKICRAHCSTCPEHTIDISSTTYGQTEKWSEYVKNYLPPGVNVRLFKQSGRHTTNFSIQLYRWLKSNLTKYDVIHIHSVFHPISSTAMFTANRLNVPYIVRPLGTLSPYTFNHRNKIIKKTYFEIIDKKLLNNSSGIHYTSEQEFRKAQRLGLSARKYVIPLPYESMKIGREKPHGNIQLLYLSRLHPKKGVELLLQSLKNIVNGNPDIKLMLAGSGDRSYEKKLIEIVNKLDLGHNVVMTGFVDGQEKERLIQTSDIFILPSYEENFGIAIAEAMDAGLPVIITKGVDIWDTVEEYNAGLIAEQSVESITSAIRNLVKNRDLRETMGKNGQRLVKEEFDPLIIGKKLVEMYYSIDSTTEVRA